MRTEDIQAGVPYAVTPPYHDGHVQMRVRAVVVEKGVEKPFVGGRGGRMNGIRVRIEGDIWRASELDEETGRYVPVDLTDGFEYVVTPQCVVEPWEDEKHGEQRDGRRETYEMQDRVRAALLRLGLDERVRGRARLGWHDVPGFTLAGRHVQIDLDAFEKWLKRIDPNSIAEQAVSLYQANIRGGWPVDKARLMALNEVAEGVAVSDSDIEPEDAGAGGTPEPVVADTRGGPRS